jgi:hypothetical protein
MGEEPSYEGELDAESRLAIVTYMEKCNYEEGEPMPA